jgi:RNA polymerase sigma factor (sigma-70 family)
MFDSQRVGQILGEWQARELRVARGFPECRGLSTEQLEDIYQETVLALYTRPYQNEEHLRNALRTGIKHRSLRLHRDERRRGQILAHNTPSLRLMAQAGEEHNAPEPATLAREDRMIASEFLTELNTIEQRVFWLLAENMQYRAIAPVLAIPVNQARNAARSCARKRERFQLLYDTGRLCGYRAHTIQALQNGEGTSEELAQRAFAHLESCSHCRAEHKTNAKRLRRSFRDQAAALLPPVFVGHIGWLAKLTIRARILHHRLAANSLPPTTGIVRERVTTLLAGTGITVKITTGVATVAVIATGTIAATRTHRAPAHPQQHLTRPAGEPRLKTTNIVNPHLDTVARGLPSPRTSHVTSDTSRSLFFGPGHVVPITHSTRTPNRRSVHRTGGSTGSVYLALPAGIPLPASTPARTGSSARTSPPGLFSP